MTTSRSTGAGAVGKPIAVRCARLAYAAVALLAVPLAGQSPLTTTYAGTFPGIAGSQVFFDLNVLPLAGITIKSLDVNLSNFAGGFIAIRPLFPAATYTTPLAAVTAISWGPPSIGLVVSEGPGKPTHVCLAPPLFLPFGVNGVVVQYLGAVTPEYTVNLLLPVAPTPSAANLDVVLLRGDYQPVPWLPLAAPPETFSGAIHYEIGAGAPLCVNCANKVVAGFGCPSPCPPFPVLALDSNFPVLGETLDLVTTGASPCATFGGTIIGFGLVLGLAGFPLCLPSCACFLWPTPDVMTLEFPIGGGWTTRAALPANPALCGAVFYAQAFSVEPAFTVLTSNYLTLTAGN